ncbi:MAG: N-acetylmuramoyl-L-alanine amidase [Bacteroidia bacterium]
MQVIKLRDWNDEQIKANSRFLPVNSFSPRGLLLSVVLLAIFSIQSVFNKNHASVAIVKKGNEISSPQSEKKYSSFLQAGDKIIKTIIIDAGHGGKDPGCIGHGNIYEKDIALDIALRFGKLIEDSIKGVKVIYTRKTDKFIELYQRAAIANTSAADIFVSIHCNYNPVNTLHGFESYIMGTHKTTANLAVSKRENESILLEKDYNKNSEYEGFDPNSAESDIIFSLYQNAFMDQSARLASKVHEAVKTNKVLHTKDVKQAGFLVLWKTAMPSILIETGFLSNDTDLKLLNSEEGRKKLSYSLMVGFRNYRNWYANQ